MYLDTETVENILSHRPVYLAIHEEFDYEHTTHDVLTVEFAFEKAALHAIRTALKNAADNKYRPQHRWHLYRWEGFSHDTIYWSDGWETQKIDACQVQQWLPGRGLVDTRVFDFDAWFKSRIVADHPTSEQIGSQLARWSKTLADGKVPPELLQRMQPRVTRFEPVDDRALWVERYGTEAPGWRKTIDISFAPDTTDGKTTIPK